MILNTAYLFLSYLFLIFMKGFVSFFFFSFLLDRRNDNNYWKLKHPSREVGIRIPITKPDVIILKNLLVEPQLMEGGSTCYYPQSIHR